MRVTLILLSLCALIQSARAQNGNDWIVYGQPYVKIPVGKDGIYRVTQGDLLSAGFPVSSTDARKVQLFHRGVEQAIYVAGESDNKLDASDYIEFYGRRNDGSSDRQLYPNPTFQPNPFYNLFNDTTSYFLTAGSSNGKRIELYSQSNTGLSPEPFYFDEKLLLFTNNYSGGVDYGYIFSSTFDRGEGWMSTMLTESAGIRLEKITGINNRVTSAPKPSVEIALTGRGPMNHAVQIFIGQAQRLLTTVTVTGYETQRIFHELEWSDITAAGELTVGFQVNTSNANAARISLNYIKLNYARELDMNSGSSAVFNLRSNTADNSYLEIKNFIPGTRVFDITDPASVQMPAVQESTSLNAVIRTTSAGRKILLQSGFLTSTVKPVNFSSIDPNAYNYFILTHSSLRSAALGHTDPVQAFADYRASTAGGSYNVKILDIDNLYDQFSFGEKTPLAIFNMMKFFRNTRLPDYFFIIGKGLETYYDNFRNPDQFPGANNLIPTAGLPASDMLFSAGLTGDAHVPAVPTGRLPALVPEDVAAYLNKVIEMESKPFDDLARKNILHLSGGIYTGEPAAFRGYLEEFGNTAEGFLLGGNVTAIAKQSTDIKTINVAKQINEGVGLVTFFGHASPGNIDFDIGKVTDDVMGYKNKGKYPVLLMNGCDAGGFFLHYTLFGADWVNAADRGAIGFIAHSSFGYAGELRRYTRLFYEVGYTDPFFFTKGVGDLQKEVAKRYLTETGIENEGYIAQAQQMLLMGDPAVKLFGAPAPDFEVKDENVSISSLDEAPITIASDSFSINFIVRNYGQARNHPLLIEVIRTFADKSTKTYDSLFAPVLRADTLHFIVRDNPENGFGDNTFEIRIDAGEEIDEIREDNNSAYIDFFIPRNGTLNLFPANYSIVSNSSPTLTFQHTDISSAEREFVIEIDTLSTFLSEYKRQFVVSASVLARHEIELLDADTMIYFWRTKLSDPTENESKDWTLSTFTFIRQGPEGWAQVNFQQFYENPVERLIRDPVQGNISFDKTVTGVDVKTFGAQAGYPPDSMSLKIDNVEYLINNWYGCRTNTINLVAFDRTTTIPYQGIEFQYYNSGGRTCGRQPWVINSFMHQEMVTANGDDLIAYVDGVEEGDSVVLYSYGNASYELWPLEATSKLGELGISASQITSLQPGEPVIIFARKGSSPGDAKVVRVESATPDSEQLIVNGTVTGRATSGEMRSVTIGPASSWGELTFKIRNMELTDSTAIDVLGVMSNSQEVILLENITVPTSLSAINAAEFRYLRLRYKVYDDINLTPAQLDKWIVTYEPVPEGLISYDGPRETVSLQEGMKWEEEYGFINVSEQQFTDSLNVRIKITNRNTFITTTDEIKILAPLPGDTTLFTVTVNSHKRVGLNDVEVFVNPQVFPERYYSNNHFLLSGILEVTGEEFQPVLDVTIDGRYITNSDFVDPQPVIAIRMWDENRHLFKSDTVGVEVSLAYPCNEDMCPFERINFSRADVYWQAATPEKDFQIIFSPADLQPGKYTLRVSISDESGNGTSGPYEISFRIGDEQFLSVSSPYPNPSREELNFDLVSSVASPEKILLQLTALDGTLVYEGEHGENLHTGTNLVKIQTKHLQGAGLTAGMFLYRIIVTTGANTIEKRGKVVIVR